VLDWKRGKKLLDARHKGEVTAVAFRPDGKQLASAGRGDHTVRLWDVSKGKAMGELEAPEMICSLLYSPDGTRLAGISRDSVRIWDVPARSEALTLRGAPQRHWDPPFNPRLAFSPDGARLASTNWDESISVWEGQRDVEEGHRQRREETRRLAAEKRALFWHLQETAQCLKLKNESAARFHLMQTAGADLPSLLKERRARLQTKLEELARSMPAKGGPGR
jgi:WD40 repeat protein